MTLPRLYLITTPSPDLPDRLAAALAAIPPGAALVQLRDKQLDTRPLLDLARRLLAITLPRRCPLLVNERLDIALAAGADGVHLPADGLDVASARTIAGPALLIGASTHTPGEATAAARAGANLVVLGPVWPTPSKPDAAALGPELLAEAVLALQATGTAARLFALGGIDSPDRAAAALATGVHGIAGIRAFLDPTALAALHTVTLI